MTQYHYCRVCNRGHGLYATTEDNQVLLSPIPNDPLSLGAICDASQHADKARLHVARFAKPQKKENGQWISVSWEQALSEIGTTFAQIRKHVRFSI